MFTLASSVARQKGGCCGVDDRSSPREPRAISVLLRLLDRRSSREELGKKADRVTCEDDRTGSPVSLLHPSPSAYVDQRKLVEKSRWPMTNTIRRDGLPADPGGDPLDPGRSGDMPREAKSRLADEPSPARAA